MTSDDLRFFAEYRCYPTWITLPAGGEDNPDPHDLAVPGPLADAVVTWSDDFDALFDEDDFGAPLFASDSERAAFDARGRDLAEQLARAVAGRFSVRYRSLVDSSWTSLS
jgi:hypothetical protein